MSSIISLDFDGVLHRASDIVAISFPPGMQPFQMQIALQAQQRFKWNNLLEEIIVRALEGVDAHDQPKFIVHSTWRLKFSDEQIKWFMPPVVANNLISLDHHIEKSFRESATSDEYLTQALEHIDCSRLLVIDDRPEIFRGGRVEEWMQRSGVSGKFVWCDPNLGVSGAPVMAQVFDWVVCCGRDTHHESDRERHSCGVPS